VAFSFQNSKGTTYYLHQRETTLKNGTKQNIFFFAKEPKDGVLDLVPGGYEVSESRNGLPVLRKADGGSKSAASKSASSKSASSKSASKTTSKSTSKAGSKKSS
jgi:hypothetical protein